MKTGISTGVALSCAVVLALSGSAQAQDLLAHGGADVSPSPAVRTYGTSSDIVRVVYGFDFDPFLGAVLVASGAGERLCGGPCGLLAGLQLPAGAVVSKIELEACDSDATQQLQFALLRRTSPVGAFANLTGGYGETGVAATPGCGFFIQNLTSPETIDNLNSVYFLDVRSNSAVNFMAVRVFYRLQVSPAPGAATFPNDVPTTHPFFRFVEALAAAGITGGCGTGQFCPDTAVTRGQMAVFLATALGLHFPY